MIYTHKPIQFNNVSLEFTHKTCFNNFTAQINSGERIAIIGRNGSGKSALLKMLQGFIIPTDGELKIPKEIIIGYVPQIIEAEQQFVILSGGQRFNKALTEALSIDPHILLLDEPTNHLDSNNRKSLLRMLNSYYGTLIVVSHDVELLSNNINKLWHIDNNNIYIFSGNYRDYIKEISLKKNSIQQQLFKLKNQKKDIHQDLMQEQVRAAKSRNKGEKSIDQRKWPTITSKSKARRAEKTSGNKKSMIDNKKNYLIQQLSDLQLPEIIVPKFSLNAADIGDYTLVFINDGDVKYHNNQSNVLNQISLTIGSGERVSIQGDNGSGKSTLLKAILNDPNIIRSGNWYIPKIEDIGYLDQHYNTLNQNQTVFENIYQLVPDWGYTAIRQHLNDFLFSKTEQVDRLVATISGGEKAKLALAQIAAKTPKLLILDEIVNNLDLETRNHVVQVLKNYPGAMIVVSHEEEFLIEISITKYYIIHNAILTNK